MISTSINKVHCRQGLKAGKSNSKKGCRKQRCKGLFLTPFFLLIIASTPLFAQPLPVDDATSLLLHFDGNVNGAAGETPMSAENIQYALGIQGSALTIVTGTFLRFDTTGNLNPRQGSIEFWVKSSSQGGKVVDMGIAGGLTVQVGSNPRPGMSFNIYGANGNPEDGVSADNSLWQSGVWGHYAFTWGNRDVRLYYNGRLAFQRTMPYDIPDVQLPYFNVGSSINSNAYLVGLLDELRISNRVRTPAEICQSYLMGIGNVEQLSVANNNPIVLYPGGKVYLNKPTFYQVPKVSASTGTNSTFISNSCVSWSVADGQSATVSDDELIALKPGSTFLIGTVGAKSVSIPLQVKAPSLPAEKVSVVDEFLRTPAACHTALVPVLVIVYLPTQDGANFDTNEGGFVPVPNQSLGAVKNWALNIHRHTKFSLEEGSKFRGFSNPAAKPYVGYKVVDYIYVYEPLPRGFPVPGPAGTYFPDYNEIIKQHRGKYYVDTLGVKEIWLMGYHTNVLAPLESNMASGTTGNISNSYRWEDDMPKFDRTYTLYNYNITRGGNEATHNHGHQIESMVDYVGERKNNDFTLFRNLFRGFAGSGSTGRVGDTHHPPNAQNDYDYNNSRLVASDIFDWKPAGGAQTMVNNNTWASIPYAWPSGTQPNTESNWYIMWLQSIPGNGNAIPYNNKFLTNWWRFLADWDDASAAQGLFQDNAEQNMDGCNAAGFTYVFNGSGNWSNAANWNLKYRPSNLLPAGSKILIDHTPGGSCTLDVPFDLLEGVNLEIAPGKKLIIPTKAN